MASIPSTENVIVGFSQVNQVLGGANGESVMPDTRDKLLRSGASEQEATMLMFRIAGALKELEKVETNPRVLSTPHDQFASGLQSYIAQRALVSGKLEPIPVGYEVKFDTQDWLGWAGSFLTWARRWLEGAHSLPKPMATGKLPDPAHFAILGDWGTGLYGAPICAQSIGKNALNYQILLHLGDVYYAGLDSEERDRFLQYWPAIANSKSYSLNSNHEMYTGGYGYFDVLLQDRRFKTNQTASYFAMDHPNFRFMFLDTAYVEHDFPHPEIEWIKQTISAADGKKIVLFSHHQLYSRLDNQGPKLLAALGDLLNNKKIFAWYWGHEHRCVIYDQHPVFKLYGRCIGHGGMPYDRGSVSGLPSAPGQNACWKKLNSFGSIPASIVLDGPNAFIDPDDDPDRYGPNGYLSLLADGTHLKEIVHDAFGNVLYQKDLC
jgi:hypothetical protein